MVQEVTTTSWGSRIMSAFWGVLFGIALIIGSCYLVFWNEGNGLHTAQSLEEAQRVLISVPNAPVDPKNDNLVIYTSGLATTDDVLHDALFDVSEKAIQLNRHVEMYQWEQEEDTKTEKNMGGSETETKTYTYKQTWSSSLIDSSEFKEAEGHRNPASMPIESKIQYAQKVTLGDFTLPDDMVKSMSGDKDVDLAKANVESLKEKFGKPVHHQAEGLYFGDDMNTPKIGDLRVTMTEVLPGTVSVIAQQNGTTMQPYMAQAGKTVSLLEMGQVSPQEMIHNAEMENVVMTWLLRLASLLLMMLGFGLIMKPVAVLADVVPFFGSMVGFGTGLIAFICGLGLWTVALAISWFVVRPLWAVGLIVIVSAFCYWLYVRKKQKNLIATK
jgi:hypothetical protein